MAVTSSNSWDTTYRCVISWIQRRRPVDGWVTCGQRPGLFHYEVFHLELLDSRFYGFGHESGLHPDQVADSTHRTRSPSTIALRINITMAFDGDNDGMPDGWEIANGLSPGNPADAGEDPDADGLSNVGSLLSVQVIGRGIRTRTDFRMERKRRGA